MSAFTSQSVVLVTGANGHVAQHVVDQLLSHPAAPRVRATVRSANAAETMIKHWYPAAIDGRLDVVIVPDIVQEHAFDEAVEGVTHIAHIASPFVINVENTERDLLQPAIRGTLNILEAASREPSIEAVVITSSFAAIYDDKKGWRPGYTYTRDDWNPITYEEAADPNLDLSQFPPQWRDFVTYCASKTLAERSAWDYYKKHTPSYTLSVINPVYIGGPYVLPLAKGAASMSFSDKLLWQTATDGSKLREIDYVHWVDVRDVARAHVAALEHKEANGKRYLLTSASVTFADIASIIRRNFPYLKPAEGSQELEHYDIDSSPALTELGLGSYIPFEKTVADTIAPLVYSGVV